MIEKAEEGDIRAIRELADRLDGKPMQAVDANVDVSTDPLTELLKYVNENGRRANDFDRP